MTKVKPRKALSCNPKLLSRTSGDTKRGRERGVKRENEGGKERDGMRERHRERKRDRELEWLRWNKIK